MKEVREFVADVNVRKRDVNGNTYHDVVLYDKHGDKVAEKIKVYGYGTQYQQTIREMVEEITGQPKTWQDIAKTVLILT